MLPIFPATLPRMKQFGLSPHELRAVTPRSALPAELRRRSGGRGATFEVAWMLTDTQFSALENFYRYDLVYGNKWFLVPTPLSGEAMFSVAQFTEEYTSRKVGFSGKEVSATLETPDRSLLVPGFTPFFTEDFESGLGAYTIESGTGSIFTLVPELGSNVLDIASQTSGVVQRIRRSVSPSGSANRIIFKFSITSTASDDAGILQLRDGPDVTFSFIPRRELAFDATRRAYVNVGPETYALGVSALPMATWLEFDYAYGPGANGQRVVVRVIGGDQLINQSLAEAVAAAPDVDSLNFLSDSGGTTSGTQYDDILLG